MFKTKPVRMASDPSGGVITSWKHNPLDDVIAPMADHVIMTFPAWHELASSLANQFHGSVF